jgi:hypothetical protein
MTVFIKFSKDIDKLYASCEANIKQLSSVEQLTLECECTDYLQQLVDYYNSHVFKNFQLSLKMEDA